MALNACIACLHIIHPRWIQDASACWMLDMLATRPVALFTANIPFRDLFRMNVVVHRVATVASGSCWPLHIVRRIEWLPPISAFGHEVRPPYMIGDVPLGGFGKVVVANFREISLLPNASVDERDLLL